ncbi:hypothetical protein PUNSTDRAFT_141167 [Punctularia strigosozonata HHB-11173 SS5]|uniref:uncharacterized protein n=1 Tax=Punctularia strigosozonata (strain HHB-11173) TaxID=741275 RepID=UPI00044179D5|nr:uncharacterized protein PUNSTDRAFT_141167 [Punctularia strigosozonata HHB-11173 SS5]EIN12470.1 hypothetical protein PUNSTDRAFT_141167 [Punctularia strigosozonata HHB-11173 SS5]
MGQANSRATGHDQRRPADNQTPFASSTAANGSGAPTASASEGGLDARRRTASMATISKRASTVRKKVMKVVGRSTSSRSLRVAGEADSMRANAGSPHPSRKRRFSSRRWSKAPAPPNGDADAREGSVLPSAADNAVPIASSSGMRSTSVASLSATNGKGKERAESDATPDVARPSTPLSPTGPSASTSSPEPSPMLSDGHQELSQNIGSWLGGQRAAPPRPTLSERLSMPRPRSNSLPGPDLPSISRTRPEPETSTTPATNPAGATDSPSDDQDNTRPFPPAGTLVVVQGVVHTTDTSAASAGPTSTSASTPSTAPRRRSSSFGPHSHRPPTPIGGGRNRLSQLLSRPANAHGWPSTPASAESSPNSSSVPLSGSDGEASTEATSQDASSSQQHPGPGPDTQDRRSALSPSSIDVLGTLLSVAAAATAASLVTGSSDPLFSSGLAAANPAGAAPTPAAPTGLPGALGALAALANNPILNPGLSDRRTPRTPWESLRDRFGAGRNRPTFSPNPAAPASASAPTPAPPTQPPSYTPAGGAEEAPRPADGTGTGTPRDARDVLLAEMVRALNSALGTSPSSAPAAINESGQASVTATAPPPPLPTADANRPLPPEGSFERFLVNLQIDLRRALSDPDGEGDAASGPVDPATVPLPEDSDVESEFDLPSTGRDDAVPQAPDSSTQPAEASTAPPQDSPSSGPAPSTIPTGPSEASSMPPHGRTGGGINWWRLYRFPPMPTPQARGLAMHRGVPTPATTSPLFGGAPPPAAGTNPSPAPTSAASESANTRPADAAPPAGAVSDVVVPIIVVGLQSVGPHRHLDPTGAADFDDFAHDDLDHLHHHRHHHRFHPDHPHNHMHDGADPLGHANDSSTSLNGAGRGNGRSWPSRAADAVRGLMPGAARRGPPGRRITDGPGSRTFLIYVIGGYYPPNHSIVTGADNLDSFEALLELAELLGQVKPPVATRDDIEKSGLQIIKPSDLAQYEKEGKVASNCVDRCLICLDDYAETDELRLMTCRHTFHKDCVDKWMQTGRNNCPACRGKGVPTGDETPSPTSAV